MRRLASVVVLFAGISVFAQGTVPAPQAQPTFRTGTNLTEVDAIVTDKSGNFVRGLTRDDFEILEDHKPQTVSAFSLVDLPVRVGVPAAVDAGVLPDVATNKVGGRVYLLVLDLLNLTPMQSVRWIRAARQFVREDIVPGDLVGLAFIGRRARGLEFTTDKARVMRAIDGLSTGIDPDQIAADATLVPSGADGNGAAADAEIAEVLARESGAELNWYVDDVRRAYEMLGQSAQYLIGLRERRKAIVMFSEGIAIDMNSGAPNSDPQAEARGQSVVRIVQEVIRSALRANISIYTVDARGLSALNLPGTNVSQMGSGKKSGPPVSWSSLVGWNSLRTMSDQTGGRAIVGIDDLAEPYRRIVEDSSRYYLLGYDGPTVKPDGGFHEITVRVKRPDLKVEARKGYYASSSHDDKIEKAIDDVWAKTDSSSLLSRSLPTADLGLDLRATAAPIKGSGQTGAVAVSLEVPPGGLSFTNHDGVFSDDIEIAYVAMNELGAVQAKGSESAALRLRPQTHDDVAAHGWRFVKQLEIAPGQYQIRLAVRDKTSGRAGTVYVDVDVPDFSKAPLQIGAFALSSPRATDVPTAGTLPALNGLLPGPPMASRAFHATDRIGIFTRVSENVATPHTVDIETTIRTAEGKEVLRSGKPHDAAEVSAAAPGYLAIVPLTGLAPGSYVLTISATSSLGGKAPSRSVPFTIE